MLKSEKEKMLSGEYYFADDKVLIAERDYARNLTFEFNNTKPIEKEKRQKILMQLIKARGSFLLNRPSTVIMDIT